MQVGAMILAGVVAVQHILFFVLEAVLWEQPLGRKVFRLSVQDAATTAALAKNQGVYNLFLTAGILWGLSRVQFGQPAGPEIVAFFLVCVIVAALVGGATVSPRILMIQGAPATVALILAFFAWR